MSQQINLFNPVFLKQKKHFSAATMSAALGIILTAMIAIYAYAAQQRARVERLAGDLERKAQLQRAQLAELVKPADEGRGRSFDEEMQRLQTRIKTGEGLLDTLRTGELGNTEGFSRYLEAFARRALPGVWLTGFTVSEGENELTLRGRVLNPELITGYLRSLNAESVMRGRKIVDLRLSASTLVKPTAEPAMAARTAAPGGAPAPLGYLEFSLAAPRTITEVRPAKQATTGAAARGEAPPAAASSEATRAVKGTRS